MNWMPIVFYTKREKPMLRAVRQADVRDEPERYAGTSSDAKKVAFGGGPKLLDRLGYT